MDMLTVEITVYTGVGAPCTPPVGPNDRCGMWLVKTIRYPDGGLFSLSRLDFDTGEWVGRNADESWPASTVFGRSKEEVDDVRMA